MILLCYDGSPDSQAAIERTGKLMPGQSATVLTIWEPFVDLIARTGAGIGVWTDGVQLDQIDTAAQQNARERSDEGLQLAQQAGLNPQARTRARDATIAQTILAEAEELEADAIVLGSRGLTGLKSLMLGSVSHAVLQHADRPVLVVPSPQAAAKRAANSS